MAFKSLAEVSDAAIQTCRRWDRFCHRLFHAYRDLALAEMGGVD